MNDDPYGSARMVALAILAACFWAGVLLVVGGAYMVTR